MTGMTTYTAYNVLNWVTGQAQTPSVSEAAIGLFLTVGQDNGVGFVEVSGISYARVITTSASWGAPTGIKPIQINNTRSIAFPVSASNWGTVTGFGVFDTNNNLLWFDYLGTYPWVPFTAAVGNPGVFDAPAHGLLVGDQVVLTAEYGGQLPLATTTLSGLQTVASVATDTFTLGAYVTASGSGMLRKVLPLSIGLNQTAAFNPATLVLQLA